MNKIVKMYWSCPYCETADIDGLVDECPNCGRHKPENTKYHLAGEKQIEFNKKYNSSQVNQCDILTEKELNDAGIDRQECDGNHKEWVCSYCNSLNNWTDDHCSACNSPRSEAVYEYGMSPKEPEQIYNAVLIGKSSVGKSHPFPYIPESASSNTGHTESRQKDSKPVFAWIKKNVFFILGILLCTLLSAFLLWPQKQEIHVTNFYWERNISLEEYKTVKESGWSVPAGGQVYETKTEIQSYTSVLDHYETVTETKSRQVIDHYDTEYYYTDNGNGTATEHTTQTPVYKTEYYTETKQEPVYRQEPVYATKYYYEIDKWLHTGENYTSSGYDKNPYWNKEYLPLTENKRDTDRSESYDILFSDSTKKSVNYDVWESTELNDGIIATRCRLGITYKIETVSQ